MEQMTFLDFFAGIGGFRKGFELCGMSCVGHCEIDKYADRSYRAIHDVKEDEWYAADITKVAPADLPRADLWAGGFPCQDISVAGRQRGLDGARSGLFFTLAQLVKGQSPENRPTWIVLENVKNLLSIHGGWDFATVLDTLASLGYHIEYGLLNTKYFGPPQNRERVFIVACRHPGAGRGPKIFPVPAGSGKALIQLIGGMQGQRVYDPAGISVTMAAQSGGWGGKTGLYFVDLCNGNPKLTDHARCIKAKYNSGITNRGGDNSGVLISPAGMDKDAVLSFVDICTGKAKLTREARCILSAYNRTISNWGGSSGVFYNPVEQKVIKDWDEHLVVIASDAGDPYCLDLRRNDTAVFWAEHGAGTWDFQPAFDCLEDFLESVLDVPKTQEYETAYSYHYTRLIVTGISDTKKALVFLKQHFGDSSFQQTKDRLKELPLLIYSGLDTGTAPLENSLDRWGLMYEKQQISLEKFLEDQAYIRNL